MQEKRLSRRDNDYKDCRGGQSVGLIEGYEMFEEEDTPWDEVSSQHPTSVGFVKRELRWSSESFDDYMVMTKRRRRETLLKIAWPKLKISINGHLVNIWIESGSPKSISTMNDIKKTLGRTGIELKQKNSDEDKFWNFSNNRINFLGKLDVELTSYG